jgi:hypothetical protein
MKTSFTKGALAIKFWTTAGFQFTLRIDFIRRRRFQAWLIAGTSHAINRTVPHCVVHAWQKAKINV